MLSKGGNKHTRTLNNTEWGGGGGRVSVSPEISLNVLKIEVTKLKLVEH